MLKIEKWVFGMIGYAGVILSRPHFEDSAMQE